MGDACKFSTYGYACGKPVEHGRYLCEEHAAAKCSSCGQPATHGCDFCGQFVCGAPLCDECTFGTDTSKPSGTWGFMNHIHISKPEFADKHENARLKAALASHTSALAERDARIAELEAALKPFAWIANLLDNCGYDDAEFVDDDDAAFQAGDFRRARAALAKEQADA